jgi:hypothetical protein
MTIDLTPKDDKISPLRELDWQDDDFAMEVVSGHIWDRDLHDIMDNLTLLNDRAGDTTYMPSMAEAGDRMIRIAIPADFINVIEAISEHVHNLEMTDGMRVSLLHGMSIYEFQIGNDIRKLTDDMFEAHVTRDSKKVRGLKLHVGVTYDKDDYQLRVDGRLFKLLKKWAAHSGMKSNYLAGLCVVKSFRTHQRIKGWYPYLDEITENMEYLLRLRLKAAKVDGV